MIITQRGVLPPVNFLELDTTLRSSILGPSGTRLIHPADLSTLLSQFVSAGGGTTVLNTNTTIVTSGALTYALNDLLWINCGFVWIKGVTAGECRADVRFTPGTGVLQYIDATTIHYYADNSVAGNGTFVGNITGFARCTTAGTVTVENIGFSIGSNSTVGSGGAALGILKLN